MTADPAGNRSRDLGEFDVQFSAFQRTFRLQCRRLGRSQRLLALINDVFRDGLCPDQGRSALELALREFHLRLGVGQLTLRLLGCGLILARINFVEQVADADDSAVLECHFGHKTGHTGADLHLFHCVEAARKFVPIRDHPFRRLSHRHRRGWRCRRLLRWFVAASKQHEGGAYYEE